MEEFVRGIPAIGTPPSMLKNENIWLNDKYQVNVTEIENGITWLSIKRLDKECIHDWRELQTIKNMLTDPEREALEIYPAESRLVDTSNQFHLWVLPKGEMIPFGYGERLIVKGHKGGHNKGSSQREFQPGEEPKDAITIEEAKKMI